ncbi:hypothetical protein ACMFMG_004441 [Clarireedia jacksonii]
MFAARSQLRCCNSISKIARGGAPTRSLQTTSTANGPVTTQKRMTLKNGDSSKKSSQNMATFQGQSSTKMAYKDAPIAKLADTLVCFFRPFSHLLSMHVLTIHQWMERNVFDYGRKSDGVQQVQGGDLSWSKRSGYNAV